MWLDSKAIGFAHYWLRSQKFKGLHHAACRQMSAGSNDLLPNFEGYRARIQQHCQDCERAILKAAKRRKGKYDV